MEDAIIVLKQVSKQYKNTSDIALSAIDLNIYKNQIHGILGPNGAGKTTLISMLCGLLKPSTGMITVNSLNFSEHPLEIKQQIGVVPQEYALYPTLTAYENLLYFGAMYGLSGKTLRENIAENLELLGLTKFKDKKIKTYSGGMKRRANLIAGILHRPTILFLDEPTVGVDVQSKNAIIKQLKKLNKSGTTIIYTSHHLREAQEFCTQVTILDKGRIITGGSPSELIKNTTGAEILEDVFISLTGSELRDHA
ncbi:MAG: ABC transporter ATP-binding protein [Flavobacteriales bacterium]|nr:MAG: ABC transporter ATP-binding protein [Flavobacteriales bacterium]PIE49001.1 MAG: ABC transporter ATP-binding protein [Flavobacteriales bacterium]